MMVGGTFLQRIRISCKREILTPDSSAVNHNPNILLRTQDLPPLYEENSCVYIFEKKTLMERQNRIGLRPYMLEIDPFEAVDIDNEINFQVAEAIWRVRQGERA